MRWAKQGAREVFFKTLNLSGVNAGYRRLNARRLVVLYYHGVCDDDFDLLDGYDERHLRKSEFRRQLDFLRRHGYRFVSLTEAVDVLRGERGPSERLVTLTFDDGFRNVLKNAVPIMREFGAKGCLYVVSDLVESGAPLWTDWVETIIRSQPGNRIELQIGGEPVCLAIETRGERLAAMRCVKTLLKSVSDEARRDALAELSPDWPLCPPEEFALAGWEELRAVDPEVLEIGSHSRSHPRLAKVESEEALHAEVAGSKSAIEANLGRAVIHFCYPDGSYDDRVLAAVKRSGYRSATTTRYGLNERGANLLLLKRAGAGGSVDGFKARVSGAFRLYPQVRLKAAS